MAATTTADATSESQAVAEADASAWWRLWAVAALAHVFGMSIEGFDSRGVAALALGLVALAVLALPEDRRLRVALPASVLLLVWFETPLIGNHWLIAGLISVAALLGRPWSDGWLARAAPGLRLVLLVFYSFAAFAKLNSGFFDPVESCARFFANQTLEFWQLPQVAAGSPVARILIFGSVAIELSVPVLLLIPRTRRLGVLVAIGFHLLLTIDLRQHFYDFTLVLVPLFLLFTPAGVLRDLDRRLGGPRSPASGRWFVPLGAMVVAFTMPLPNAYKGLAILMAWVLWLVLLVVLVRAVFWLRWSPPTLAWRPDTPALGLAVFLLVGVTALNGLAPYLELKTATGFNMYANLTTGGGETNHLVIPSTAGLRPAGADLALILDSSDTELAEYIESGFALPFVNLADHLADRPEASVTFERNGEVITIQRAGDHPELRQRQHPLVEKFGLLRAVPTGEPAVCQNAWLPAR